MTRCAVCGTALPSGSLCPRCNVLPTELPPPQAAAPPARIPSPPLSSSAADFAPGELFAERYRIVALLGRGGMGEVYRADDLRLGQTVALKFLPAELAQDRDRLERFYAEVRLAREVSHPNVCRVYDIGEAGGRSYLAMEYVDGEDLASLLRRIGRLPEDKALDVSRQLCAGLAAVHDRGVLHRDLKPANVMLDGHGRVRLTDFGLAAAAAEAKGSDLSGTPQYMAPEQFALRPPSVRSDLYALGLVLYELFTGKPAVAGATFEELRRRHQREPPTPPSRVRPDLDPAVERVILRCLEKEPESRPASALAVAAALPGGDPLAAALAAGETPSPELVAAAGAEGALRPGVALACFAAVAAGLILLALLGRGEPRAVTTEVKPPEVLAERARAIVEAAGYPGAPADRAYGYDVSPQRLRWRREQQRRGPAERALAAAAPPALQFWYRESPRLLVPVTFFGERDNLFPDVTAFDPPPVEPGMVSVVLDPQGRLLALTAVPAEAEAAGAPAPPPLWAPLFAAAGLDRTRFGPVAPRRIPPVFADARGAWEGALPGQPPVPIRVEAAALRGRPVHLEIRGPWNPAGPREVPLRRGERAGQVVLGAFFLLGIILAPALVARRNLRLGRGDRRGASRIAACIVVLSFAAWAVGGKHVPALAEIGLFVMTLAWAVWVAGWLGLLYLALEPYLRRRWPHTLVSWNRLLAGRWRDPLVGRDLLLGVLVAVGVRILLRAVALLGEWISGAPLWWPAEPSKALSGTAGVLSNVLAAPIMAFLTAFVFFFLYSLLRALVRRDLLAAALFVLLFATIETLPSDTPVLTGVMSVLLFGSIVALARGLGLLALVASELAVPMTRLVLTLDPDVWYAEAGFVAALVCLALAGYGAWVARAGQPLFRGDLLES
ncbi:MAG TPA: serine/threonine-protein kinase [Thermoanaerobaculia bacterium]|nr:serine/threonine-protein kinase [Thermoanaerobaculia bacterium]